MLAGTGIDVDAVAGDPGEKLRFGLHAGEQGGGRGAEQIILLGAATLARLRGNVLLAVVTKTSSFDVSFGGYPDWLVILAGTLVAALASAARERSSAQG